MKEAQPMGEVLQSSWVLPLAIWMFNFLLWTGMWWLSRRDRQRWQQEEAARELRWALQRQLWEMERQIREEAMPEAERERHRQYRQREAAITREARRRLESSVHHKMSRAELISWCWALIPLVIGAALLISLVVTARVVTR